MTSSFMNHVSWSLGDHENNYLTTFLSDLTKYDIVVILVFFFELFDEYPIRGLMRKVFYSFLVGTACRINPYRHIRTGWHGIKSQRWRTNRNLRNGMKSVQSTQCLDTKLERYHSKAISLDSQLQLEWSDSIYSITPDKKWYALQAVKVSFRYST